jgi:hypothetical protein
MCQPAISVSRTQIRPKNPPLARTGARRGAGLQDQKAYSRELAILPKWSTIGTRIVHVPCFEFLFIYILVWSCYEGRTYKGIAYPCSVASTFQFTFSLSLSLTVFLGHTIHVARHWFRFSCRIQEIATLLETIYSYMLLTIDLSCPRGNL